MKRKFLLSMVLFANLWQIYSQCVAPTVSPTTICAGNLAQLTPTNTNPAGTTYNWYSSSTSTTPLFTGDIYTPQLSATKTFYVSSVGTGCPTTRSSVKVTVNPAPTGTLTTTKTSACVGDQVSATVTYGNAVSGSSMWLSKPTLTAVGSTVITGGFTEYGNAVSSGTYSYFFVTAAGCSKTISTNLTVNPALPEPTFTNTLNVCQNVALPLAPSVTGGTWAISPSTGASINSNLFTGTVAGVYAVTYTISNNGCSKSISKNITVNASPKSEFFVNPTTVCYGETVVAGVDRNGDSYENYTYPSGAVNFGGAGGQSGWSAGYNMYNSGYFSITLTNSVGCKIDKSIFVTVNPQLTASIVAPKTSICKDETIQMNGVNANGGTGSWSITNSPMPALTGGATENSTISSTGLFEGKNPGIYKIRYTVSQTLNGITCSVYDEKEITVGALPFTILGPDNICVNGTGNYSVEQVQTGGAGNNIYSWYVYLADGNNTPVNTVSLSDFNQNLATLNGNNTQPLTVRLTADGKFYCVPGNTTVYKTASATKDVNIVPLPSNIRLKCADANCNTIEAVMKDGSSISGLTFNWENGAGNSSNFTNPLKASISCVVTNNFGCSREFRWYAKYENKCINNVYTSVYDYTKALYCQQGYDPSNRVGCYDYSAYRMASAESSNFELSVFPNPVDNFLSFNTAGSNGTAIIHDIEGLNLLTQEINNGENVATINISSLQSGFFILTYTTSKGKIHSTTFFKQ